MDWIDKFRETMVRPGPSGAGRIGHEYSERGERLRRDAEDRRPAAPPTPSPLDAPDPTANVGDMLASGKSTALAVTLGVNRPHYVEAALWLAMGSGADPKTEAGALLDKLIAASTAAEPEPAAAQGAHRRAEAATSAALADVRLRGAQRRSGRSRRDGRRGGAEARRRVQEPGATLYQASDARRFHRERRFATAEAIFD